MAKKKEEDRTEVKLTGYSGLEFSSGIPDRRYNEKEARFTYEDDQERKDESNG